MSVAKLRAQISSARAAEVAAIHMDWQEGAEAARKLYRSARLQLRLVTGARRRSI